MPYCFVTWVEEQRKSFRGCQSSFVGNGKVEELISYNQLLEHLENTKDHDMGMVQKFYRVRAIIGNQGPLHASDQDLKGSKCNV